MSYRTEYLCGRHVAANTIKLQIKLKITKTPVFCTSRQSAGKIGLNRIDTAINSMNKFLSKFFCFKKSAINVYFRGNRIDYGLLLNGIYSIKLKGDSIVHCCLGMKSVSKMKMKFKSNNDIEWQFTMAVIETTQDIWLSHMDNTRMHSTPHRTNAFSLSLSNK